MYHSTDPRTALGPAAAASAVPSPVSYPADYIVFGQCPPAQEDDSGRHWYARGQNFVVGYSDCDGSVTFRRTAQPDEWMLLLPGKDL
ncbi:MAG: hypothetical protein WBE95_13895, partial [Trebonia sp.]|uniref:hypothetical protein n=1 Tax=Trebonia sp. TaxID=2767075 RepID=UPI003C723AFA